MCTYHPRWQREELSELRLVLPSFKGCTLLDLSYGELRDAGCKAVCDVLRMGDDGMASLKELRLERCSIGDEGGHEMAKVIPLAPEDLELVVLWKNAMDDRTRTELQRAATRRNHANSGTPLLRASAKSTAKEKMGLEIKCEEVESGDDGDAKQKKFAHALPSV